MYICFTKKKIGVFTIKLNNNNKKSSYASVLCFTNFRSFEADV